MDIALPGVQPFTGTTRPTHPEPSAGPKSDAELRSVALRFETAFVAEMLKHSGVGEMRDGFNGGAGEAAFSGLLTWEYAGEIAERGTMGIADKVYAALRERAQS
ncbi:MAG: rod-binding protein [Pseudomonadota bacterium]